MKFIDVENHCSKCCLEGRCECKDCKVDECDCGGNE